MLLDVLLIFFLCLIRLEGFFPTSILFNVGIGDQMSNGIVHKDFVHADRREMFGAFLYSTLEFIYSTQSDNAALVDNGNAVTESFRLVHVMSRDDDRGIMHIAQLSHTVLYVELSARIKPCCWFGQ